MGIPGLSFAPLINRSRAFSALPRSRRWALCRSPGPSSHISPPFPADPPPALGIIFPGADGGDGFPSPRGTSAFPGGDSAAPGPRRALNPEVPLPGPGCSAPARVAQQRDQGRAAGGAASAEGPRGLLRGLLREMLREMLGALPGAQAGGGCGFPGFPPTDRGPKVPHHPPFTGEFCSQLKSTQILWAFRRIVLLLAKTPFFFRVVLGIWLSLLRAEPAVGAPRKRRLLIRSRDFGR